MIISRLEDDVYLSEINLAGTHDSCTACCSLEKLSRCQSMSIRAQLEAGVRLFDMRLVKKDGEFYLIHSLADCYTDKEKTQRLCFGSVLGELYAFLGENPGETLVVSVKQDRGIRLSSFFTAFYKKYIEGSEESWYLENRNPRLSQCRGKIVLMRRCKRQRSFRSEENCGLCFAYWRDQDSKRIARPESLTLTEGLTALIQDRYSLAFEDKWSRAIKPFLDECSTNESRFCIHFLSTANRKGVEDISGSADYINKRFSEYPLTRKKGWFFADFPSKEQLEKIMNSNLCEDKEVIL